MPLTLGPLWAYFPKARIKVVSRKTKAGRVTADTIPTSGIAGIRKRSTWNGSALPATAPSQRVGILGMLKKEVCIPAFRIGVFSHGNSGG